MTERLSADLLAENYHRIRARIEEAALRAGRDPKEVTLLAATKTVDADTINRAIELGIETIGENRVQELLAKYDALLPVHKHLIGHLQTNKVKDVICKAELIHSVDSLRLAAELQKQAERFSVESDVLLEVNIGDEESKSGFRPEEVYEAACQIAAFGRVHIRGLMAIPPVCDRPEDNRKYFVKMRDMFLDIRGKNIDNMSMEILSMGMSDDYDVAVSEGATLVRVGTALFGRRNYNQ